MAGRGRGRSVASTRTSCSDVEDTEGLKIEHVPIDQLRPWPGNPRMMPPAEPEKLKRSVEEFGFVEPVVVRKQDHTVIGGHQRVEAARALGHTSVPVVHIDVTEAQAKALNLALNKIHGAFDLPRLATLLEELSDLPDLDETLSGFDEREIDDLLAEVERGAMPSPR